MRVCIQAHVCMYVHACVHMCMCVFVCVWCMFILESGYVWVSENNLGSHPLLFCLTHSVLLSTARLC